ncbi:hypothetical protein FA15DRAFT_672939 [Coprinopsis marcescibilis]|uniref:F-box domain-containing protein n=1 Tax=Coprinopsis marcescibilis TaxID=230819 RepID=A0A5C3KM37_COPMA|nr:hypothetical protein FA15DRAFT_672939 [Coprinopsis marcescibilis]
MDSPITVETLPIEILGEIFQQLSLVYPDAPSLLSRVSTTFNRVVRSTPAAWGALHLVACEGDDTVGREKARLWFSMVGTCMVDVTITMKASSAPLSGFFLTDVPSPSFGVSDILRHNTNLIGSLRLEAASEFDARSFVNAVYRGEDLPDTHVLESFSVKVSSTTPPTQFASSIAVPNLPNLRNLNLLNHSIAFLASRQFDHLLHMSVTRPIRFPPFPLASLLQILRSAPLLQTLSIESRILDGAPDSGNLIHLPHLTQLSLRTNVVPSILSLLLLPNLQSLQLDDLNGRRSGSSQETGSVLRQLLVRMELPSIHRAGTGLKSLELIGVEVCLKGDGRMRADDDGVWEWCIKRMKSLEVLKVKKVDPSAILDILGTSSSTLLCGTAQQHEGSSLADSEWPCPRLRHITCTDSAVPLNLDWFREKRANVEVVVDVGSNLFSPALMSPNTVDFLSVYTDIHRSPSSSKPGSNNPSPVRTTPLSRHFGPWVVLGHEKQH